MCDCLRQLNTMEVSFPASVWEKCWLWSWVVVPDQGRVTGTGLQGSFVPAWLQLAVLLLLGIPEAATWQGECSLHCNAALADRVLCPQDLHREAPDHHSFQQHLLEAPGIEELEQSRLSWSAGGAEEGGAGRGTVVCVSCPCPVLV